MDIAVASGQHPAFSAWIIGAANVGALLVAFLHCNSMSKENEKADKSFGFTFFRQNFLLYTIFPIIGNLFSPFAVSRKSLSLAILGRILIGMGSSDLLNRHFLATCLPAPHLVIEAAKLVQSHHQGVVAGLLVGGISALYDVNVRVATVNSLHTGSFLMAGLWALHGLLLLFFFQETSEHERKASNGPYIGDTTEDHSGAGSIGDGINGGAGESYHPDENENREDVDNEGRTVRHESSIGISSHANDDEGKYGDNGSIEEEEDSIDGVETPESQMFPSSSDASQDGENKPSYGDELHANYGAAAGFHQLQKFQMPRPKIDKGIMSVKKRFRKLRTFLGRVRKALGDNVAIPVTLAVIVFVRTAHEILFSSCPLVTDMYFHWRGGRVSLLLGALSFMVFPIGFISEKISRRFDERTIIKRSLFITLMGLLVMVNWGSVVNLAAHLQTLFQNTPYKVHQYDWVFGVLQYVVGISISFTGVATMEPAILSLMSKVAPITLKSVVINCGNIVTVLSLVANIIGDLFIVLVGLSHRLINADILNSLAVPLLAACIASAYIVRRHFFFLM